MTSERMKRIAYKINIRKYLMQLSRFCGRDVMESELISLDHMNHIRSLSVKLNDHPKSTICINKKDLSSQRFRKFIVELYRANTSSIFIWTELTDICGFFQINSILDFTFDIDFDIIPEEVILLLAANFEDKMTIGISNDDLDGMIIELDIIGKNWPKVVY